MDIFRLASTFCKLAQTADQNTEIAGSLQELTKEVEALTEEIQMATRANPPVVEQAAMPEIDNIERMLAQMLSDFNQDSPDWSSLAEQHKQLQDYLQRFYNSYNDKLFQWNRQRSAAYNQPPPERYQPLSKIQETLTVVGNLLQQQANQLPPPPTEV
jgi:DNA repair ATPase RecN